MRAGDKLELWVSWSVEDDAWIALSPQYALLSAHAGTEQGAISELLGLIQKLRGDDVEKA